jgi:membrane associated rhomboid family serine protease
MFMLFPYAVDRSSRKLPVVTITLIVLNVVICLATMFNIHAVAQVYGFKLNWAGLFTWFSSMFLHTDPIFHLGGNMYFLWMFGSVVEDGIGRLRYIGLYILGGLMASLTHGVMVALFVPAMRDIPAIGASGALAAVMGMFAVRYYRNHMKFFYLLGIRAGTFEMSSILGVALWGLREVVSGLFVIGGISGSSVANWAHIGGLVFGVVIAMTLGFSKDADKEFISDEAERYISSGTYAAAATKYAQLAEMEPDNPDVVMEKAWSELSAGDDTGAVRDLGRGIDLLCRADRKLEVPEAYVKLRTTCRTPLEARTLQTIGSVAESVRRLDVAAHAYYETLASHPGTKEAERAHFRLAHVYLAQGMAAEARQTWQAFRDAYPVSQWTVYADRSLAAG